MGSRDEGAEMSGKEDLGIDWRGEVRSRTYSGTRDVRAHKPSCSSTILSVLRREG